MKKRKGMVYVPSHKWKLGKDGTHPGYYRKKRPIGKKRIIGKNVYRYKNIRDEHGHILGIKRV